MHVVVQIKVDLETVVDCKEATLTTPVGEIRGLAVEAAKDQLRNRLGGNVKFLTEPVAFNMRMSL